MLILRYIMRSSKLPIQCAHDVVYAAVEYVGVYISTYRHIYVSTCLRVLTAWRAVYDTKIEYLFVPFRANYADAKGGCRAFEAQITSVRTQAESDFLLQFLPTG